MGLKHVLIRKGLRADQKVAKFYFLAPFVWDSQILFRIIAIITLNL